MSFDEIQSIWESQESLDGAIDKDALTQRIKARNRLFLRIVGITEVVMTLTLLFLAAMFMKDPLLEGHDRILILAGLAALLAALFVWTGRIARKNREVKYDESLLGIVEHSLDGVDYQIKRMRSFLWWFAGPASLGLVIGLFIVDASKLYLFYTIFIPGFVVCMGLTYWQIRREIRTNLAPERARLQELHRKLLDD